MPDISMCPGGVCPSKETCYLYRALPNELWQSYTDYTKYIEVDRCAMYKDIKDYLSRPLSG